MAGEWIKLRASLPRSPKVLAMSRWIWEQPQFRMWITPGGEAPDVLVSDAALRYALCGALHQVWCVANEDGRPTADGVLLSGITLDDLETLCGCPEIGPAMAHVGWAVQQEGGVLLPNFQEYNNIGKERGSAAERQRKYRERKKAEKGDATRDATRDVTRDRNGDALEKRREEKSIPPTEEASASSDPTKELFETGKALLVGAGISKASAGKHLGKLRKEHGDEAVLWAVREADRLRPSDPGSYLERLCRGQSGQQVVDEITGGVSWS